MGVVEVSIVSAAIRHNASVQTGNDVLDQRYRNHKIKTKDEAVV